MAVDCINPETDIVFSFYSKNRKKSVLLFSLFELCIFICYWRDLKNVVTTILIHLNPFKWHFNPFKWSELFLISSDQIM